MLKNDFIQLLEDHQDLDIAFKSFLKDFKFIFNEEQPHLYFLDNKHLISQKFLDRATLIES
jgi:hypothetical protein